MEAEIRYFNSVEAAKILGVNVSTIKRWTDEGKLHCIKTAGGHRKFMMKHLGNYVKENKKKNTEINLFPMDNQKDLEVSYRIMKRDYEYLINYIMKESIACHSDKVQKVLNGLYLGQCPLHEIYDKLVTPVLHKFGDLWHRNKLTIVEEHFGSQTIRDSIIRLQGIINIPKRKSGRAVFLNLSSELHDIALKMAANILELRGFQIFFSGQNTDVLHIGQVLEKIEPDRLYISITWPEEIEKTQQELDEITEYCQKLGTKIFVGGQGSSLLNLEHPQIENVVTSFKETYSS